MENLNMIKRLRNAGIFCWSCWQSLWEIPGLLTARLWIISTAV